MKKLIKYLVEGITGSNDFEIEKSVEGEQTRYEIKAAPEAIGMIIGKSGKTIRAIRNIVRIRAVLSKINVFVGVSEAN